MSIKSDQIRLLNDHLRRTFTGGRVVTSAAVAELDPVLKARVLSAVREFNDFTNDNDPHKEHDCFLFDLEGDRYAVKIDYYDKSMEYGSEDPSDPEQTTRVMTIMLASDM